jgi:hypothetical protein
MLHPKRGNAMKHSRLLILLLSLPLFLFVGTTSVAAATVPSVAAATVPSVAAATVPSVDVVSATLVAKGAGVQVVLTGSCDAGAGAGVFSATVTQAVGNRVAQGTGYVVLTCTGEPQEATVLVTANVSGARFHVRDALVSASIVFGCCSSVSTAEVVRIVR